MVSIGTSKSQLEQLSDPNTVKRKISRRDIALAVSQVHTVYHMTIT